MKKLATLTRIVQEVLEDEPETQSSDGKLVIEVFERLHIDPHRSLYSLVACGHFNLIRSIIRARCKVQQARADLCNEETEARRHTTESTYRAYARSFLSEILAHEGEDK